MRARSDKCSRFDRGVTEIDRGHAIDVGAVARKVGNWPAHVVAYIASFRLSTLDLRQGELESDERTAASPAAGERTSDWRAVVTACPGVPWQAVGPQASSLDPTVETFLLLLDHVTVLATSTVSLQHLVLPTRWQLGQSSRLG